MDNPLLVVAIPSRGLVHSRTMEDVVQNLRFYDDSQIIFCHGKPQPDAQNNLTQRALALDPAYIWFVDDDMAIPHDFLREMFDCMAREGKWVITAHYPVGANRTDAVIYCNGRFESAGAGCILMRTEMLQLLEEPYWRADTVYQIEGDHLKPTPAKKDHDYHGLHDVDFWQRLRAAGVEPAIPDRFIGQYELVKPELPKYGNHTQYDIREVTC